jgi:hypothetical protein
MNISVAELFDFPLKDTEANYCYIPISKKIAYRGTSIQFQDDIKVHNIDLAALILPPTLGQPSFIRLSDEQSYVNTAMAIADRKLLNAKMDRPSARMITRQLYLLRHVLDWLRARGVYHLSDATKHDMDDLMKTYAEGGWVATLNISERWHRALDLTTSLELKSAFHYKTRNGVPHIETMRQPFWRERIGWGGILPLPTTIKTRLESTLKIPFTPGWKDRQTTDAGPVGRQVVRNILSSLNDWCLLPSVVDRLQQRSAVQPAKTSRRLSTKAATRTANLKLEVAVRVISAALRMLYEIAPSLIELLREAASAESQFSKPTSLSDSWLAAQSSTQKLSNFLEKPLVRWLTSGTYAKSEQSHTVDQVLSAVQCSCAIILAAMNARRNREICDAHFGLRVNDLTVLDDDIGIYQTLFYIEKTYFERHAFYINRTSADAIRCLETLQMLCLPAGNNMKPGTSIFTCGRRSQLGIQSEAHLSFTNDTNRTRSLISFFQVALDGNATDLSLSAHMFRRFYAILYFHQYEHADLRALKQQLRHIDIAMTRIYVTDPSTRPLAEQIRTTLGQTRFSVANEHLRSALDESHQDLADAMAEVEQEKLVQALEQILSGQATAGGFSRIVRKLYRQMQPNLTIEPSGASSPIAKKLLSRGYRVEPMAHGQCHAPSARRHLKARCERSGDLAREHACAHLCQGCPYHFNNEAYLENLREDLKQLESDAYDILLPPLQQARAAFDHDNLIHLISITEEQMRKNVEQIKNLNTERKIDS